MWFIGDEVEQETSAPPPKENPGSAPEDVNTSARVKYDGGNVSRLYTQQLKSLRPQRRLLSALIRGT